MDLSKFEKNDFLVVVDYYCNYPEILKQETLLVVMSFES